MDRGHEYWGFADFALPFPGNNLSSYPVKTTLIAKILTAESAENAEFFPDIFSANFAFSAVGFGCGWRPRYAILKSL